MGILEKIIYKKIYTAFHSSYLKWNDWKKYIEEADSTTKFIQKIGMLNITLDNNWCIFDGYLLYDIFICVCFYWFFLKYLIVLRNLLLTLIVPHSIYLCKRRNTNGSWPWGDTDLDADICVRSRRLSKIRCSANGASISAQQLNSASLNKHYFLFFLYCII